MAMLRNRHFWAILFIFIVISLLHYVEQIGLPETFSPSGHFGFTRHTFDRILFLAPVIYATIKLGPRSGLLTSAAALVVMLPRVLFLSPALGDAILETAAVTAAGVMIPVWARQKIRAGQELEATLAKTRSAQEILQRLVQSLVESERKQTVLSAIASTLSESLELKNILEKAVVMVSELMQVEVTMIFCLDEESLEVKLMAYEGISEAFALSMAGLKVGEGIYGEVVRTGQPKIIENVAGDPRLNTTEFQKMQVQSQLIIPLMHRDYPKGAICVAMRRPRIFTEQDTELLSGVGRQVATAIENASLYEKERLIAERLTVSERNYREIFENANDAIWVNDLNGNITAANGAAAKLTGYDINELMKMKVTDFFSAKSLSLAAEVRRHLIEKEAVEQPYPQNLVKKDGSEAVLMLTTSLLFEDGKPVAFQHIARDVTHERKLQNNLLFYVQQITTAQEEERKRIARDLHDDTAQALYALVRRLDNLVRVNTDFPDKCTAALKGLSNEVRNILQSVRRFSQDLRPSILDDLGLLSTLRWLLDDVKTRRQIEPDLKVTGVERRLATQTELMLFRIVQEALRNIEKHAGATKIGVEIDFGAEKIKLAIRDNGQGFVPARNPDELTREGRLGLAGMEERARLLGGDFKIDSEPGKGTMVMVEVPASGLPAAG